MAYWAGRNGFSYSVADEDDEILALPLAFLWCPTRSVWNVLRGSWAGTEMVGFDLLRGPAPATPLEGFSGSSCALTAVAMAAPDLTISPRWLGDEVEDTVVSRVETESPEFNARFEVRCDDRRFATAVVHQRLMAWLLDTPEDPPRVSFELLGSWLLAMTEMLTPEDLSILFQDLADIRDMVPDFLCDLYPPHTTGSTGMSATI